MKRLIAAAAAGTMIVALVCASLVPHVVVSRVPANRVANASVVVTLVFDRRWLISIDSARASRTRQGE